MPAAGPAEVVTSLPAQKPFSDAADAPLPRAEAGGPAPRIGFAELGAVLRRRAWLAVAIAAAVMALALLVLHRTEPQYAVEATLVLRESAARPGSGSPQLQWQRLSQSTILTEIEVLRSRGFAAALVADLGLAEDPDFSAGGAAAAVSRLLRGYAVAQHRGSMAVGIYVRDPDAARAVLIANGAAQLYIRQTRDGQAAQAQRSMALLEARIAGLNRDITAAGQELSGLVRGHALDDPQAQKRLLEQLRRAYQQLEERQAEAAGQPGRELSTLAAALETRAQAEQKRKTLERGLEDLLSRRATLMSQLDGLRAQAALLTPLARQIATAQAPPAPNIPNRRTHLAGSFTGALVLAFAAVLMRETADGRIFAGRMPLQDLGLPGGVRFPAVARRCRRSLPQLAAVLTRRGRAAAGPKAAETAGHILSLLRGGTGPEGCLPVLVTAAQHGDGQRLIALSLAVSAASEGRRVLLVDLEGQSRRADCPVPVPRSACPFESLLQNPLHLSREICTGLDWFDVLAPAAGSRVPLDPFGSPEGRAALDKLRREYDLILFCAPPVPDSALPGRLQPLVSRTVLVLRDRHTSRAALAEAQAMLQQGGIRALPVLNCG